MPEKQRGEGQGLIPDNRQVFLSPRPSRSPRAGPFAPHATAGSRQGERHSEHSGTTAVNGVLVGDGVQAVWVSPAPCLSAGWPAWLGTLRARPDGMLLCCADLQDPAVLPSCRRRAQQTCTAGTAGTLTRNLCAEPRASWAAWLPLLALLSILSIAHLGQQADRGLIRARDVLINSPTPALACLGLPWTRWYGRLAVSEGWRMEAQCMCVHARETGEDGTEFWICNSRRRVTAHVSMQQHHGMMWWLVSRHTKCVPGYLADRGSLDAAMSFASRYHATR